MKTCSVRLKCCDQYQSDNRETNDKTKPFTHMINIFMATNLILVTLQVVAGGKKCRFKW